MNDMCLMHRQQHDMCHSTAMLGLSLAAGDWSHLDDVHHGCIKGVMTAVNVNGVVVGKPRAPPGGGAGSRRRSDRRWCQLTGRAFTRMKAFA